MRGLVLNRFRWNIYILYIYMKCEIINDSGLILPVEFLTDYRVMPYSLISALWNE